MTTLFPQIKRVDEDETSKIIKNVLFNNQDGIKLEKIFDEFMHLTEELSYSDDDDVSDSDGTNNSNSEEDQEEDGDEEEDDDEDDEDEDDDDGDTSEDSEVTPPRGPTSWNLDQFINSQPQPQPQSPSPPLASPLQSPTPSPPRRQPKSPTPSPPQPQPPPLTQSRSHSKPKLEAKQLVSKPEPKLAQQKLAPKLVEPKREPEPPALHLVEPVVPEPKLEPEPELRLQVKHEPKLQQPALTQLQLPQSQSHSQTHPHSQNHVNHNHHKHKQPSGSCIVQIDLSKLKRIPTTKAPTPTMTGSKSILTAKALKHEADVEKDKTKQAIKYLESCMYFILHGQELEKERDHSHGTSYYNDVIPLFKHTRRLSAACNPDNPDNMTHLKINALTQKCLGILYTKLYRLRERELPELAKTTSSQHNGSPIQQADELLIGVKPSFFSAYKRQMVIFDYLKNAHDNWHNAEHLCDQHPALKIFFTTIESNCGPLTMITPFSKLMDHVQCGLKLLRTS